MANHIINRVSIRGPQQALDNLKAKTKVADEEFDFNGIVAMPAELDNTIVPVTVVETEIEADVINKPRILRRSDMPEGVSAISRHEAERRLTEYGAKDWYEWATAHWGTKWSAFEVKILTNEAEQLELQFLTAWSPPLPIYDLLKDQGFRVDADWQGIDPAEHGTYGRP